MFHETSLHKRIIGMLEVTPAGLTTAELAHLLNRSRGEVSNIASKLHCYGRIDAEPYVKEDRGHGRAFLWKAKADA